MNEIIIDEMLKEAQRGMGMGQGGQRQGDGGASTCVCPKCGATVEHKRSVPCNEVSCPKCGTKMQGK